MVKILACVGKESPRSGLQGRATQIIRKSSQMKGINTETWPWLQESELNSLWRHNDRVVSKYHPAVRVICPHKHLLRRLRSTV